MFNNLVGPARDWIRTKRETAPNVMRSPRVFKGILMTKYFGSYTPFEGLAPLYTIKQREGQSSREFNTTLTMLGIHHGRRQSALIPKKKKYLSERNFAQQDGLLNQAKEKSSSMKFKKLFPALELRTLDHSQSDSLVIYHAGLDEQSLTAKVSDDGICTASENWPHSKNGQTIFTGGNLKGPEVHPIKKAGVVYKEFV